MSGVTDAAPILVTGGTGMLGQAVVAELASRGRPSRVLSRRASPDQPGAVLGDLTSGEGLSEAVHGAAAVIHCASNPERPDEDIAAIGQLLLAARRAETRHLVYISIVGVDRVPYSYYSVKQQVEELVEAGEVPWTTLRATQFHQFLPRLLSRFTLGPLTLLPAATTVQPVDVHEVAARLVDLALGTPQGRVDDLAGPQRLTAREVARLTTKATGAPRRTLSVRLPGKAFAAVRAGGLCAAGGSPTGAVTYAQAWGLDEGA